MSQPPPGYDDGSVVAKERLKVLIGEFGGELSKVQTVFEQHLPGQFHAPPPLEGEFWKWRASAEELGGEYTFLVEKLISDYQSFNEYPDQSKLDQIINDIHSLELLLAG